MINSDKFVPKAYSKSRDYQVFLRLFDLVFSCIKSDIDNGTIIKMTKYLGVDN